MSVRDKIPQATWPRANYGAIPLRRPVCQWCMFFAAMAFGAVITMSLLSLLL